MCLLIVSLLVQGCKVRFSGSDSADSGPPPGCGNGILEAEETCDGTNLAGQTCESVVGHLEGELRCTGMCVWDFSDCHTCGDGKVDGPEQCDDANEQTLDGCTPSCTTEPGWVCFDDPSECRFTCGNGVIDRGEECDDENIDQGDGCTWSCQVEPGWTCSGTPSLCVTNCGDGVVQDDEECDDGGLVNGDGCSNQCKVERGYACNGEPSVCEPVCGDGIIIDGIEECDDGDQESGDGCSHECRVELGWDCIGDSSSYCEPICGDGLILGNEACDDGDGSNGDGCSSICEVEPYYACSGEPSVCIRVVYVNREPVAGSRDGGSWATAYEHVQQGIDRAGNGWEVWVAQGTYNIFQTSSSNRITLESGRNVYGGFAGDENDRESRDPKLNETILDGRSATYPNNRVDNVVEASWVYNNTVLDGFTVAFGGNSSTFGGGLNAYSSTLTVSNCTFRENEAESGGAVYIDNGSITFSNCRFEENYASQHGGAVYFYSASGTLEGSVFSLNQSSTNGGAVAIWNNQVVIRDSDFNDNLASSYGGGIYLYQSATQVESCRFDGNMADRGGAFWAEQDEPSISNTVFLGNRATGQGGGAVYLQDVNGTTISNCTFHDNTAISYPSYGNAVRWDEGWNVTIFNTILWGFAQPQLYCDPSCDVQYSDIYGGYSGNRNIQSDPIFVNPTTGDLHLSGGSPCIDAGYGYQAPSTDADGNPRVDDPSTPNTGSGTPSYTDMGAFEYQP